VTSYERLHPALQYHIVNSLGWSQLRPLQEASLDPVLDAKHCLLLAPTAGGKTEAAMLPILSRMASEEWPGLSVLYLCPIKALLNNLEARLSKLSGFIGRRVALWHGDIGVGDKRRAERDPPDILLTTPESLEGILLGRRRDHQRLLGNIRCVVIDELHAFAGDDRGWHVLALLERIRALSGFEMQRIGLSATVGDPQSLLDWLAGHCEGERKLVNISAPPAEVDLSVDYVGTLDNAASVISQLHGGEKRLVFCDSRSRVEELAQSLRTRDVDTFVSHAALSIDTRRQAEQAFTERQNCVIVATSTLELGLDVGDLDRVIQIDAPPSVASFLQRLGRTGRREGLRRNTLFLATTDMGLLESAALIHLFRSGYVEPVSPPPSPYHILVQQYLSSILQANNHLEIGLFEHTLQRVPQFRRMIEESWPLIVTHLEHEGWTYTEGAWISFGGRGDKQFSGKGLAELCVSFDSPQTFSVLLGDKHLGNVDPMTFKDETQGPRIISLGGRPWKVASIDWRRQRAYVEPSEERGKTRWLGNSRGISARIAGAVKSVIIAPTTLDDVLTMRARSRIAELAEDMEWTLSDTPVHTESDNWTWWTYAGSAENRLLAAKLQSVGGQRKYADGYSVVFRVPAEVLERLGWHGIRAIPMDAIELPSFSFKFEDLLPPQVRAQISAARAGASTLSTTSEPQTIA
jgi:ATP-dependent helicase Lhr and Lhr-like helicase